MMLSQAPKESLHLFFDENCLKAAKISVSGGKKIVSALYYKDITGVGDTALSLDVRDAMQALGAKVRQVSILLSTKYVITKTIEVPSLDEKEIWDIVKLQAVRHTPYSKDEVIVGHMNLDVILERYTKSLLVIASNDNVRKKTDVLEMAVFNVHNVHLVMEAVAKAAVAFLPMAADGSNFGVVYFDNTFTDIIFINKNKPVYTRNISIGAKDIKQNYETSGKQLMEEFKKTIEAYQAEDATASPKRFIMLGVENADQKSLLKKFEDELQIKFDTSLGESLINLSAEAKKTMQSHKDVSFLDVIYDGVADTPFTLDLIPADLLIRKAFRAKGQEFFIGVIFLMIIFVTMMCTIGTKIYFRQAYLKNLRNDFEHKQKDADELGMLSEQTRLIKEFSKKKGKSLLVLNELQKILPEEMYLSELSLTAEGKASIKGTSPLMSSVFAFVTLFENSPYFKSVATDYTKSRKENDKDVSDFGITATIEDVSIDGQ